MPQCDGQTDRQTGKTCNVSYCTGPSSPEIPEIAKLS